jgi:hypothetical protein
VIDADARLWHPWLRINRVLRVMLLQTRWSAEAWSVVRLALCHLTGSGYRRRLPGAWGGLDTSLRDIGHK